jgi:hypothetical protein
MLRRRRAIHPLPHMPPYLVQGQLYLYMKHNSYLQENESIWLLSDLFHEGFVNCTGYTWKAVDDQATAYNWKDCWKKASWPIWNIMGCRLEELRELHLRGNWGKSHVFISLMYGSNISHCLGERRRAFLLVKKGLILVWESTAPLVKYFFYLWLLIYFLPKYNWLISVSYISPVFRKSFKRR